MKKYEISENLLNAIFTYLQKKPFNEVVLLIQELQQNVKIIERDPHKFQEGDILPPPPPREDKGGYREA